MVLTLLLLCMGLKMPSTYKLISSTILSTSAGSVTFSAIPNTYTDLVVRGSTRGNQSGNTNVNYYYNNSNASVYSYRQMVGENGTQFSQNISNYVILEGYAVNSDTGTTASAFSSFEIYLPNYSVAQNHPDSFFGVKTTNATTPYVITASADIYRNAAAITRIDLQSSNGSFVAGSSFYLYGISKS